MCHILHLEMAQDCHLHKITLTIKWYYICKALSTGPTTRKAVNKRYVLLLALLFFNYYHFIIRECHHKIIILSTSNLYQSSYEASEHFQLDKIKAIFTSFLLK